MKQIFFLTLLSLNLAQATASDDWLKTHVDDLSLIDLREAGPRISRTYSYPGLHYEPPGTPRGLSPDCLIFVNPPDRSGKRENVARLLAQIEVRDGTFWDREPGNLLELTQPRPDYFVYFLKDLSKYLTGLQIHSKDGESLKELVDRELGKDTPAFLLLSRGCRAIREN